MRHWVWEILCARQAANWYSWVLSKMLSFVSNISQLIFIHKNVFYLMFSGAFVSFWNTNNVCFKSLLQYSPLLLQPLFAFLSQCLSLINTTWLFLSQAQVCSLETVGYLDFSSSLLVKVGAEEQDRCLN